VRVKVHAIVVHDDGRLVVARERHRGVERLALPGARVHDRESITRALIRGVSEATRLKIEPVRLLYIAEIPGLYAANDLHLVWLAEPRDRDAGIPEHLLIDLRSEPPASLNPPIVNEILADIDDGWPLTPRWLSTAEPGSGRVVPLRGSPGTLTVPDAPTLEARESS
jgi:hypothetical protein